MTNTATARLIYETSEDLDRRTIAHATARGHIRQLEVTDELIATLGDEGITVRDLDCSVRWTVDHDPDFVMLGLVGDELVMVGRHCVDVWTTQGEHARRFELAHDWPPTHIAFDALSGRFATIGEEAQAALYDLRSGEQLYAWDMRDDYDFGSWIDVGALLFRDNGMFVIAGHQITVWVDGELDQCAYRRGRFLSQSGAVTWHLDDRWIFEVSADQRGLVVYDVETLTMQTQQAITGDLCASIGGAVYAWSDQHVSVWDGEALSYRQPDWRGHYHTTLTPDGRHAISMSIKGEICVQQVAQFEQLDREPLRVWAMDNVTAFAVDPAGTCGYVVCGIPNWRRRIDQSEPGEAMSRVEIVELDDGAHRVIGMTYPLERLRFVDDDVAFGTSGKWVDPVTAVLVTADNIESAELAGQMMGAGDSWIATKPDDSSIVFHAATDGEVAEVARVEIADGIEIQSVETRHWAFGWDDAYNQIAYQLETGHTLPAEDGDIAADLLSTRRWDGEYCLEVRDLRSGSDLGEWRGEVNTVVMLETQRRLFFSTYDGQLFQWSPPGDAERLFVSDTLGEIWKSADERYLVASGTPVRIFDIHAPEQPLVEVQPPFMVTGAYVAGEFLLVAGLHGLYAVYGIVR